MANHSGLRGKSGKDMQGMDNSERGHASSGSSQRGSNRHSGKVSQAGSSTQMKDGQSKSGMQSGGSGSRMNSPHDERASGEMGPQHTNAGNTGFSSDQISPKTQNLPQTGPSASHPGRNKGQRDRSR